MELTLKNEHCAVTVTDAGRCSAPWCGTAENIFGRGPGLLGRSGAGLLSHCGGTAQGGVYRIWQALPYEAPRRGPH